MRHTPLKRFGLAQGTRRGDPAPLGLAECRQLCDGVESRHRRRLFEYDDLTMGRGAGRGRRDTKMTGEAIDTPGPASALAAPSSRKPIVSPPSGGIWCGSIRSGFRTLFADVLIIGGGIAGIRAALAVDPTLGVIVVTKDRLLQSNSAYAQGGIAGVFDPLDNFGSHAADTMAAGKGLCDKPIVDMVVQRGARAHPRADRLRSPFRHARRRDRPHAGRGAQPSADRARPGRRDRAGSDAGHGRPGPLAAQRPHLGIDLHHRPVDARGLVPRGARLEPRATAKRSSGPSRRSSPRAGRGGSIARRPIPRSPRPTGTPSPFARAPSSATWSSSSSIRRCSISPAAPGT